jgi:hypothetical protein
MFLKFKIPAFLHFGWLDFIDVLLVSVLLFQLYRIVRGSVAINIFVVPILIALAINVFLH